MRQLGTLLFALLLAVLPGLAGAEIGCVCTDVPCSCFLQLGDIGIAVEGLSLKLVEKGYLPPEKNVEIFNDDIRAAVIRLQQDFGLPETGTVDDDTLTCLIWGMTAADLDIAMPDSITLIVWVPTDGGVRMHKKDDCCDMIAPRMMTVRNGVELGIVPCGICNRTLRRQLGY